MHKHILVIGPSGSGKTYISAALRAKGVNAPDADLIEGLSDWVDGSGKRVAYEVNAGKEFLDNHEFVWHKEFLINFLKDQKQIYLFGMSGNIFEMLDLFDEVYFLKAPPQLLAERLRHESRQNPMGRTDYQLQNALNWAKTIEDRAKQAGIKMIDAAKSPEEILREISS
jgi:adenylate kinase family enzyme